MQRLGGEMVLNDFRRRQRPTSRTKHSGIAPSYNGRGLSSSDSPLPCSGCRSKGGNLYPHISVFCLTDVALRHFLYSVSGLPMPPQRLADTFPRIPAQP